jgi:hypothetical protein
MHRKTVQSSQMRFLVSTYELSELPRIRYSMMWHSRFASDLLHARIRETARQIFQVPAREEIRPLITLAPPLGSRIQVYAATALFVVLICQQISLLQRVWLFSSLPLSAFLDTYRSKSKYPSLLRRPCRWTHLSSTLRRARP